MCVGCRRSFGYGGIFFLSFFPNAHVPKRGAMAHLKLEVAAEWGQNVCRIYLFYYGKRKKNGN